MKLMHLLLALMIAIAPMAEALGAVAHHPAASEDVRMHEHDGHHGAAQAEHAAPSHAVDCDCGCACPDGHSCQSLMIPVMPRQGAMLQASLRSAPEALRLPAPPVRNDLRPPIIRSR